jgi:hypothetical protein
VQFFWFAVVLARINSELWVGRAALYNLMCAFVCVGAAARRPWYATTTSTTRGTTGCAIRLVRLCCAPLYRVERP